MNSSLFNSSVPASACSAASIPYPNLFGAEFLSLEATLISNLSSNIHIGFYTNHGAVDVKNVNYCNVTVTYTHPGQDDKINVQVWLPQDTWNGRMQHIGGSGWQAGLHYAGLQGMTAAVGEGYATLGTDAGLGSEATPVNWGLLSPGNPNLYLLQDLVSTSLNDAAIIGKAVVNSYYGQPPRYSYYSGCSQGGRQGMMLAQKYPDAYDGIAASAPAINWNEFLYSDFFPTLVMNELKEFPAPCELDAITAAAIAACDGIDGVTDGVITNSSLCAFDPRSVVGAPLNCTDSTSITKISSAAAIVAEAAWTGGQKVDNTSLWFGMGKDTPLTASVATGGSSVAATTCASNGTCSSAGFEIASDWIKLFSLRNASADLSTMTREEYLQLWSDSLQQYGNVETNNPDLSRFRDRGGKLVSYHGLADILIPHEGTTRYYDKVTAMDAQVHDYYRLFLAPGLGHCLGGTGAYPAGTFDAMRNWVENGTAPETLLAESLGSPTLTRPLCAYPKMQYYNGTGNATAGEGFYCA
ncbi:carboxylic ester hydrolase-10 [Coleophoma cylindrospora]|uniref:Carboxylic ester hydrolase n=1 Tax=Coleophoma cylindrospora TaxID=1849047 RepID=A0A3D8RNI5_9HELO|nr:carboxylic ester hydrolase-10 [Coleophoma cylindrospora]